MHSEAANEEQDVEFHPNGLDPNVLAIVDHGETIVADLNGIDPKVLVEVVCKRVGKLSFNPKWNRTWPIAKSWSKVAVGTSLVNVFAKVCCGCGCHETYSREDVGRMSCHGSCGRKCVVRSYRCKFTVRSCVCNRRCCWTPFFVYGRFNVVERLRFRTVVCHRCCWKLCFGTLSVTVVVGSCVLEPCL